MKALYTALGALQDSVGSLKKTEENPFFKSSYININGVLEAVRPHLKANHLVVTQPLSHIEGKTAITTRIVHTESGEEVSDTILLPQLEDPQKMGSAITYFRRYALISLLGLPQAESEDDDGNTASNIDAIEYNQEDPFNL